MFEPKICGLLRRAVSNQEWVIMARVQGDCREETRRAYKIPISAKNGPFGKPGR
jgi:hypothetical protein